MTHNVIPFVGGTAAEGSTTAVDHEVQAIDRRRGEKLLLTVAEAASCLGIGRTLMYRLIQTGAVKSVQVGRLRRIRPEDLEAYAASLEAAPAWPLLTSAA